MATTVEASDGCTKCGACVAICPRVFQACRWTGMAEVIVEDVSDQEAEVLKAVGACRVGNLTLKRNGTAHERTTAFPRWQAFSLLVRRIHYYTSIPLVMLLLFYGLTGFLGNRADWFSGQTGEDGAQSPAGQELSLPADLPLTVATVLPWLAQRHAGHFDSEVAEDDGDFILCDAESVWGAHTFTVDKAARTYRVESRRAPWITALVNLHRGKHADWRQKLLVDLAAFVLVLVSVTGLAMVALARSQPRERVAVVGLSALSVLLMVLLLVGR